MCLYLLKRPYLQKKFQVGLAIPFLDLASVNISNKPLQKVQKKSISNRLNKNQLYLWSTLNLLSFNASKRPWPELNSTIFQVIFVTGLSCRVPFYAWKKAFDFRNPNFAVFGLSPPCAAVCELQQENRDEMRNHNSLPHWGQIISGELLLILLIWISNSIFDCWTINAWFLLILW